LRFDKAQHIPFFLCVLILAFSFLPGPFPSLRAEEMALPHPSEASEKTDVSVPGPQAAAPKEAIPELEGTSIRTEEYTVKEGDYLIKILRERGLLADQNLPELLSLLKKLNNSLQNLDMIRPGEKIVILVKVVPGNDAGAGAPRRLKTQTYRVQPGDILSRVAINRYGLSARQFNREYLPLFRECNPFIENPDTLYVGQAIELPIYPPEYADTGERAPILRDLETSPNRIALKPPRSQGVKLPRPERVKAKSKRPSRATAPPPARARAPRVRDREATIVITDGLGNVVTRLGEEWIPSGEHVIPMTSGGHINLNAESYPIIRLDKGLTVIVDMHSVLPKKMAKVIESTWASYRVVQLTLGDNLRSAIDKILRAFNYPNIYKKGQPLTLDGEIPVRITGDWIIAPPEPASGKGPGYIVINLMDRRSRGLPRTIKNYLKVIGVEVIEYPSMAEGPGGTEPLPGTETAGDPASLIKAVLNLAGQSFTTGVDIPAYETRNEDFRFTVQADFYLKIKGRPHIIDVAGLNPDTISLLKDNGISVLSLTSEEAPVEIVSRVLKLLHVRFKPGPHSFMARKGDLKRNVKLTLPGIVFKDRKGGSVLVTSLDLPSEITAFLSQRGYRVLVISPFSHGDSQSA